MGHLTKEQHHKNRGAKATDKITISQMFEGNNIAMQKGRSQSWDEEGSIIPFSEQMAIISHYLHNRGYKYAKSYACKAEGLLENMMVPFRLSSIFR